MSDYPALENFLAAYFHQDWRMEHDTPGAVVAYYLDSEDAEQVAEVRADLARLAARELDEAALAQQLRELGSEYDPTLDGGTWRGWLQALRSDFG
ncbi:contact-dependent growth inhibition system immunity protein [Luteimonas aquatica]|uniref:contact-dependent growth inhibition system immunity protein n=1 Tax=Luteimonas aquatica TaxID=450364 RepID=UPI001F575EEF|nr:contact-dependent growth inhibition system immunity protein [Luteimonas aquatica]